MFQCSGGICINKRYTCDGFRDCKNGEDEFSNLCGKDPCENKLRCQDKRCIPASWCCEPYRETNCTAKVKLSCCTQLEKLSKHLEYGVFLLQGFDNKRFYLFSARDLDSDSGFQYEQQRFNDMGFLQTTVYTVIGNFKKINLVFFLNKN